jgi:hypothetical protein
MSEDERGQLIDELWPSPEPPPDLAARVVAAMQRETGRPPRRRPLLIAALSLAAAAAVAALWWPRAGGEPDEDGGQVASARVTVNIGARAAAALEPGTALRWSVRRTRVRVEQRQGSAFYRVDHGGPFQVSTPDGDIEVTGTCFQVTQVAGATVVAVLEGAVAVRTDTGALGLKVGETARLSRGLAPALLLPDRMPPIEEVIDEPAPRRPESVPAPERPSALLLPSSTRLRVYGNPLRRVSLALPAGKPSASVEVAHDRGFRSPIFSGPARGPFVTVAAPARGDLFWRLAGQREPAGHAHFLPDERRAPRARDHLTNVVSEGRPSTSIYFQGAPPALTLVFAPSAGARGYRVRVIAAADRRPVLERVVEEPRCPVSAGALGEGQYLWSATPLDEAGQPLQDRPLNKLELAYDNALETLAISQPRAGQVLDGRAVEVRGTAPLGARLFVNGTPAPLDDKGRFALRAGGRMLVFRLVDRDGAESYWLRGRPRS